MKGRPAMRNRLQSYIQINNNLVIKKKKKEVVHLKNIPLGIKLISSEDQEVTAGTEVSDPNNPGLQGGNNDHKLNYSKKYI